MHAQRRNSLVAHVHLQGQVDLWRVALDTTAKANGRYHGVFGRNFKKTIMVIAKHTRVGVIEIFHFVPGGAVDVLPIDGFAGRHVDSQGINFP